MKKAANHDQFQRIVGVEVSDEALAVARRELAPRIGDEEGRVSLISASYLDDKLQLADFDAAVLVETIEHLDPRRLSMLERTLFVAHRPATIVVTTPNREYNVLYGVEAGEVRDPDHRFDGTRIKLRAWAFRIFREYGYRVTFGLGNIGEAPPAFGTPTQAARFTRDEGFLGARQVG